MKLVFRHLLLLSMVGCAAEPNEKEAVDAETEDSAFLAAEGAAESRPSIVGEVADGETVEGSFSRRSKFLGWTFRAEAGTDVTLDARGVDGLDTVLILYRANAHGRPTGRSLALNDDFGQTLDSRIEYTTTESGTYVAIVREYNRAHRGSVALTLSLEPHIQDMVARSAEVNGLTISYRQAGNAQGPLLVLLHGMPEFSLAWKRYLENEELKSRFNMVAMDLRGFGGSSVPTDVESYTLDKLASDVVGLAGQLGYERFSLVGHDWGGMVAYMAAHLYGTEKIDNLLTMAAFHPSRHFCELISDPTSAQAAAGEYMRALRGEVAEGTRLYGFGPMSYTADNGALLKRVVFMAAPEFFNDMEIQSAYMAQWGLSDPSSSDPSRIDAQLNLYRASDVFQPSVADCQSVPMRETDVPTTILWGDKGQYLTLENLEGLEPYLTNLQQIVRDPEANNWTNHQMVEQTIEVLRTF